MWRLASVFISLRWQNSDPMGTNHTSVHLHDTSLFAITEGMHLVPKAKLQHSVPRLVPSPYIWEKRKHITVFQLSAGRTEAHRPRHRKQTGKKVDSTEAFEGNKQIRTQQRPVHVVMITSDYPSECKGSAVSHIRAGLLARYFHRIMN